MLAHSDCTLIFINQMRQKIGVMYRPAETTPGGLALKYYSSVRLEVKATEKLYDKTKMRIGTRTTVKVKKNKVAPPFREATFDILYGKGIHHLGEVVDLAEKLELIDKAGARYTVGTARIQGREDVFRYLEEHPEILENLEKEIRKNSSGSPVQMSDDTESA